MSFAAHGYSSSEALDYRREIANSAIAELFYQEAKEALCKSRSFLEAVAKALAEKTILTSSDIADIKASAVASELPFIL